MAGMVDFGTQTSEMGSDEEFEFDPIGNASPRVVIDTSPPFGSVEEAVIRFGGRGFWIPRPFLGVDHTPPPLPTQPLKGPEESDICKLEEQAAAMLNDLDKKEQETLGILKELELTKHLVEELKLKLPKEAFECESIPRLAYDGQITTPGRESVKKDPIGSASNHITKPEECSNSLSLSNAGLIMMELKQAKLNLYQSTNDLAVIRASVESLSKKMEKEKEVVEKAREIHTTINEPRPNNQLRNDPETLGGSINPLVISRELRELNYEAEQFMRTAEAAKSEVLKAMSDIEQTKSGLKVIEMRWVAAKKLEEAARAAESLALAEIRCLSNNESMVSESYHQKPGRISLSLEEYSALTDKARKAESLFRMKEFDPFRRIEEATEEKLSKMGWDEVLGRVEAMNRRKLCADQEALRRFRSEPPQRKPAVGTHSDLRNSRRDPRLVDAREFEFVRNECNPDLRRPTTSIGDILSQKLVLRDDLEVERPAEEVTGRQRVSLNQMLRRQRGETSPQKRREKDNNGSKNFFSKSKALGFVHISLPISKQSKNKIQALNLW